MNNPREHLHCRRRGCSYTTNRVYNLERHERNHEKGRVPVSQCQPCPHCTYAAGSLHNLMRHIGKKHAGVSVKVDGRWQMSSPPAEQHIETHNSTEISMLAVDSSYRAEEHAVHSSDTGAARWFWSTLQQQEKNFVRRSGLDEECTVEDRTVNTFKLYSLVKARGGCRYVDNWEDVAAALSLPTASGCAVRNKYMEILLRFEKSEVERIGEYQAAGVPHWWDDGDYIGGPLSTLPK
ncbi:hypothetical protein KR222_010589, partial [Zaprionus bogoriensis]